MYPAVCKLNSILINIYKYHISISQNKSTQSNVTSNPIPDDRIEGHKSGLSVAP